jgi:hypothetical protein
VPAKADNPIAKELQNKAKTEPEYYQVQNVHATMHQAVIKARKTVEPTYREPMLDHITVPITEGMDRTMEVNS